MSDRTEQETNRDNYNVRKSHQTGTFIDDTGQPQGHIQLGAWCSPSKLTPEEATEADLKRRKFNKECEAEKYKRLVVAYGGGPK